MVTETPGDGERAAHILKLLRGNELFADCTEDELGYIAATGSVQELQDGEILIRDGGRATHLHVLLAGELVVTKIIGGHEEVITRHVVPAPAELGHDGKPRSANYFTGEISLLTDGINFATMTAVRGATVLNFTKSEFIELVSRHSQIVGVILPVVAWRVRHAELQARRQTTIAAVERLAAGLSHELNNPAAVVVRAACELEGVIDELVHNAFAWRSSAGERERLALAAVIKSVGTIPPVETNATNIETFDEILAWAEAHGACKADVIADNMIQIGMTSEFLESMLSGIGKPVLPMALDLVCATLEVRQLVGDLREAGARISSLVSATSIYADLDRAPERLFSVTDGIDATLAMIPQRLVGIQIVRDYAEDIPEILGNARELNEVWTNLIENALDAMMGSGTLTLHARHEAGCAEVEVTDTGPGIPEESVDQIFEPFYTTKDVGKGTGLGLHMSHRIVTRSHGGSMAVRSVPGETTFLVRLPVAGRSEVPGDSAVAEMPK